MALRETSVEVNILGNVEPLKRINEMMDNVMKAAEKMGAILDKAMGGVSTSAGGASGAMNAVQKAASTASSKVSDLGSSAATAQTKMDHMSHSMHGASNVSASLSQRLHSNMGDLMMASASLSAAGYGAAKAVGYTVKSAGDFSQAMANAKSVMDPSDVKKYSGALNDLAIQQGIKTKYSATQVAEAEGELAKAGVKTSQILHGALAGSLNLATAGDLNLKDSAEIASTALNTFRDKGMTVAKAADILAGAANASATDVGELKYSLSMSATVAAGLGASLKGTSTALAVFAQNGLKGSDAGTSLKTMMMRLHPMTNQQWDQFNQLGLITVETSKAMQLLRDHGVKPLSSNSTQLTQQIQQLAAKITDSKVGSTKATKEFTALANGTGAVHSAFFKANGQVKSFASIAQLLKTHLHGLNGEQRSAALETMFGSDAIRGSNILYREGAKGVNDMARAMSKIKAADVAAQKMKTFQGSVEQMRGTLQTMGIAFGSLIIPSLGRLALGVSKVAAFLTKLPTPIKIALIAFVSMTAAILILTGVGIGLTMTFGALSMAATAMGVSLAAVFWPITLIIGGVTAIAVAAYLIIKNWRPVSEFFRNTFASISAAAMKLSIVRDTFNTIKSITEAAASVIRNSLGKAGSTVFSSLIAGIRDVQKWWKSIWPQLSTVLSFVIGVVRKVIAIELMPSFLLIRMGLSALRASWRNSWASIASILKLTWDVLKTTVKVAWHLVSGIITVGLDLLTGKWGKAWKDLGKMTKNIWGDLKTGFKDIMGDLQSLAINGTKAIGNALLSGLATGINGVSKGINWILSKVDAPKKMRIPYWTPPKFAKGTDGAPGGPSVLGDGGKQELFRTPQGHVGLSPATDTLYNLPAGTQVLSGDKTAKLLESLPHFANGTGNWIKNAAGTVINGAKTVGTKIKDAAVDVWSYMSDPSKLMDLIVSKFTPNKGLTGLSSGIVEGMIHKISSSVGDFLGSFGDNFTGSGGSKAVKAWVQQALKISGAPSSWASALETIAMKESGGNPKAVNGWDSNAKAGHPSIGLMQTIQSTFNAHAKKGYNSILNPVDNIIAAIGYIKSRYGSVFNVPGIKSMAAGGAYKGYANGGVANTPQVASLAENSWPEYIISTQPSMRKRSLGLFNRLGQVLGISQTPDAMNAQAQSAAYTPETSQTATYNRSSRSMEYHPEIHVTVKGDGNTESNVKKAVKEVLEDHYKELTGLYDPGVDY
ncbi:phage tail tape measure protein [Sporolactobacillus laevolacticus]|uniref:Phage tail tape measure protein n=1 Tax=Sporolactobacillus laevolacticus DSM 442 TaxID=1395513 RepID=V6IXT3_9BACL|nr:phage tail tape measure protein [Sporolactobacillus laevolacticus]EST12218.1 hypothetical protein P343_07925 [Sporolactobacillus laevolacticus DSM 442]